MHARCRRTQGPVGGRRVHFAVTLISTSFAPAAARHGDDPVVERHLEIEVDVEVVVEEAVDIAIVERFGAQDVRAGLEAGDDELAVLASA